MKRDEIKELYKTIKDVEEIAIKVNCSLNYVKKVVGGI